MTLSLCFKGQIGTFSFFGWRHCQVPFSETFLFFFFFFFFFFFSFCSVTLELKTHEVYRGYLDEVEDNFNMHLTNLVRTSRDGRVTHLEHAYVRGSQIRFVILPGFVFFSLLLLFCVSILTLESGPCLTPSNVDARFPFF